MQNFKETDKMAQPVIEKPVQSDEFQLLKRISISREKDIEFLQKSLKIDTSQMRSLDPSAPETRGVSPERKALPPLIHTQTPVVPGTPNQNPLDYVDATTPIPESTFNLETDFFCNTKTKIPIMSFRETLKSNRKSRRQQRETREMEVQTDLQMMNDEQQNPKRKIGFHEVSMIDLPSVDQEMKGIGGRKNSVEDRDQKSMGGKLPSLGILKNSSGSK